MSDFWSVACKVMPKEFKPGDGKRKIRGYYTDKYEATVILKENKRAELYFLAYNTPDEEAFKERVANLRGDIQKICQASRSMDYKYTDITPRFPGDVAVSVPARGKFVAQITVIKPQ